MCIKSCVILHYAYVRMLSFTVAAIFIAAVAHMYLEMFSTANVSCFTPAS